MKIFEVRRTIAASPDQVWSHFTLTPVSGGTEFHMREQMSGLLAPLIERSLPDLTPSFEKFASGLKALAERASR